MTKQEEKILDKYNKHCLVAKQKFSVKERKVLNRVFQRAMRNLSNERLGKYLQGAR